jgi:hypothetical protein
MNQIHILQNVDKLLLIDYIFIALIRMEYLKKSINYMNKKINS